MKTTARFSILAFISTLTLGIVAINPTARAVSVGFDQISYSTGAAFEDQNSQSGEADLSFSAADAGSFTPDGMGGYYAYVNVVTTVAGGLNNNWAVQNMPVSFASLSGLNGSLPLAVNFDLGQSDGTSVSSLNYSLTFSSAPLSLQPGGPLTAAGVTSITDTVDTEGDSDGLGDMAGDEGALPAANYVGAAPGTFLGPSGNVRTNQTNLPVVNEQINGCAPGAKARSIAYLGQMFPSLNVTQTAQQIYGALTNTMGSSTGTNSTGTRMTTNNPASPNFASGANAYFATNNLAIAPTTFDNDRFNFQRGINALNATSDVEAWIYWGTRTVVVPTNVLVQGGTNFYYGSGTNYTIRYGGHAAMVTQITPIASNTPNGVVYIGYNVTYVDDPSQGAFTGSNAVRSLTVFTDGSSTQFPGVQGTRIMGLFTETALVPEPSSLVMAVLGFGAVGLPLLFIRRPKRRCS